MGIRVLYGTVAHLTLETFAFVQKLCTGTVTGTFSFLGFVHLKKMIWKRWGTFCSICRPKPALATNLQVLRTAPILWPFLWSQFHHNFLSCAVKEVVRKAPPAFVQADSNFRVGSSNLDRTFFSFGPFLQSLTGYKAEKGPDSPVRVKAPPQALAHDHARFFCVLYSFCFSFVFSLLCGVVYFCLTNLAKRATLAAWPPKKNKQNYCGGRSYNLTKLRRCELEAVFGRILLLCGRRHHRRLATGWSRSKDYK